MPDTSLAGVRLAAQEIRAAFGKGPPRPGAVKPARPEAGDEAGSLDELIAGLPPRSSPERVAAALAGKIWMLEAEWFGYFLSDLMLAVLEDPIEQSPLAAELVGELTRPLREDFAQLLGPADEPLRAAGLDSASLRSLQSRLLGRFDTGAPEASFHDRHIGMPVARKAAVATFLRTLAQEPGLAFLQPAIERSLARYWGKFDHRD